MALAYLLSPTFEIVNSAGKPATGGFIEVYVAGSRNKYYCASDFNGTLHPFRIPLDSLGSNIVLAEDTGAYDVYVYNRYGTLLMSRYNVKSGGGGTIAGTITSSDGSISVTPTSTGVDLRVDLEAPSILRATAQSLTGDGLFQFSELQRDGRGATVDVNGRVMLSEGWWHYDATVRLRWPGNPAESGIQSISLYTANGSDSMPFDLSYAHSDTVQINGEFKSATSGTQFILGVLDIPAGLTVELVDFGIHSILGEGAANGRYYAGNGIQINEADRIVSVDTDVVQEKLTAGTGITITDNVISAVIPPQEQADWTQSDSTAADYIKNKPAIPTKTSDLANDSGFITGADLPTVDQTYDASSTNAQSGTAVAEAIAASLETFIAVYGVTTIGEVDTAYSQGKDILCRYNSNGHVYSSQLSSLVSGIYTFTTTDGFSDYEFTLSPDGGTGAWSISSRAIPSGTQLVPEATQSDVGEVLTVDQNGVPEWAPAQAPISAGDGIDITNNVISVDTSVVATQTDLAGKQDVISDLSSIRAGAALGATAVQDPNYVHTDNNYTDADKTKLAGIQAGAEANVQSDWNVTDTSSDAYIANKPTIPAAQVNSDWNAVSGVAEILNKPSIPSGADLVPPYTLPADEGKVLTVGPSSAYWDTPKGGSVYYVTYGTTTWEQVQAAYAADNKVSFILLDENGVQISTTFELYNPTSSLGHIEFYQVRDTIPQAGIAITTYRLVFSGTHWSLSTYFVHSNVQADWAQTNSSYDSYIKNKPDLSVYAQTSSLATVATTGAYSDLTGTPTIPSGAQLVPPATSADASKVLTVNALGAPDWAAAGGADVYINGYTREAYGSPDVQVTGDITNIKFLDQYYNLQVKGTVAGTDYVLGTLCPSLPTSGNLPVSGQHANLTLDSHGWLEWGDAGEFVPYITFTDAGKVLRVNSDGTNLEWVPASSTQVQADWTESDTSDPSYIQNKPSIPSATSDLTNDSGFITLSDVPAQVNADWNSSSGASEILNKPTIPSGTQLVPAATSADADKVLTVDAQGTPAWSSAQAPISAGDGIDITNNVVSAVVSSPLAINTDDEIWLKTGRGLDTQAGLQSDELEVRLSGTGGLMYDGNDDDGLAIQLAQYSGLEVQMNNGVQEGLNVLVDGTTIDKNASGELTVIGGGGGGTQADWTEDDPTASSYIENKPTPKTLTGGTNITVTEDSSTITISATWQNAQADWTESDPTQPAYIQHKPTIPSGNQLVPAATSQDEGKCLVVDSNGDPEWGTGGKTYTGTDGVVVDNVNDTVGLEAPVDIVAGPGIVIDNPDGNTLRVSVAQNYETVLWSGACLTQGGAAATLSEAASNFDKIAVYAVPNPSTSFNYPQVFTYDGSCTVGAYMCPFMTTGQKGKFSYGRWTITNGTSFNLTDAGQTDNYPAMNYDNSYGGIVKVVGIHRINGGN